MQELETSVAKGQGLRRKRKAITALFPYDLAEEERTKGHA